MRDDPRDRTRRARWRGELRLRLAPLRLAPAREAEIVDELADHLDDHWRDLVVSGVPEDEATRLTLGDSPHRACGLPSTPIVNVRRRNPVPSALITNTSVSPPVAGRNDMK